MFSFLPYLLHLFNGGNTAKRAAIKVQLATRLLTKYLRGCMYTTQPVCITLSPSG